MKLHKDSPIQILVICPATSDITVNMYNIKTETCLAGVRAVVNKAPLLPSSQQVQIGVQQVSGGMQGITGGVTMPTVTIHYNYHRGCRTTESFPIGIESL